MTTGELLSALADDQLDEAQLAAALQACGDDESALARWNTYHLVGEALRSPAALQTPAPLGSELDFVSRLNQRLAREQLLAVPPRAPGAVPLPAAARPLQQRAAASNDDTFRWKLVAGVASLAAVSAIAWNMSGLFAPAPGPQLAQAPAPQIVVTSPQGPVLRDARLEELLAAHRQFGTASALQQSSGFLRNATFDTPRQGQ